VALDIETYGILEGFPEQTVFHPAKSVAVDKVARGDLVQCVSLAWWQGSDSEIQTTVFLWNRPAHRKLLLLWLQRLRAQGATLLCMNTLFDVTYLRFADPRFTEAVSEPLLLEDVAIWNYLNSSIRPERSLEALARLHGFLPLAESATKKFKRYDSLADPALLHYNAADSELALRLRRHLRHQLGKDASSEYTRRWFSNLLWSCVEMTEAGVAFSTPALQQLFKDCEASKVQASTLVLRDGYGPLQGPGSSRTAFDIITQAVEIAGLTVDRRLKRTPKRGQVSTEQDNVQLIRGALPADDQTIRPYVEALSSYRTAAKVIGTYINPLLPDLAKNSKQLLIDGLAHPQWYPCPQPYGEAGGGTVEGGTVQARPTCKQPALQTSPKSVQLCFTSRFRPGALVKCDLSQIELRLAALLSGDARMTDEFACAIDLHARRAVAFFGSEILELSKPEFKKWRQVGKQGSFWFIYRGGPRVLQETVRRKVGVELALEQCYEFQKQLPRDYPGLYEWQNKLIRDTTRDGYISAPILGDRRFLSRSAYVNETTYESTICNFPIQVTAARLMCDIQADLRRLARPLKLRGLIGLNIFDSVYIDCPLQEIEIWPKIFKTALHYSVFWSKLRSVVGRSVPLDFETTTRKFLQN
jgi:DNA polymerase I-like protein with 3'-5' exonuclease and polymerase domains